MDQLRDFADDRLINGCIYCAEGEEETRDHVPSRVFLDSPFPENLPVVGACRKCNNGFSSDEEYVACLIESVIAGSTDPEEIRRPGIADILRRAPKLRARIEAAKSVKNEQTEFGIEPDRIKNILLKLARGHAAFELSQLCRENPIAIWWQPLAFMSAEESESFETCDFPQTFGEIGSRGSQRLTVTQFTLQPVGSGDPIVLNFPLTNDWVEVQNNRYRYIAIDSGTEIEIRMVISEYLACKVVWNV